MLSEPLADPQRQEEFLKRYKNNEFMTPTWIKIRITSECNLRCGKCNYWKFRKTELDQEVVIRILDEAAEFGFDYIKLLGGESLILNNLPYIISYATKLGIDISITTNGTLITEKKASILAHAGLRGCTFSIDSPRADIHDYITGVPGAFENAIKGIKNIVKYKNQMTTKIQSVVSKSNFKHLDEIPDLAKNLGVDSLCFCTIKRINETNPHYLKSEDRKYFIQKIVPNIIKKSSKYGLNLLLPILLERLERNIICYMPWSHIHINFDGNIYPCTHTEISEYCLGNIYETSLKELINNDGYKKFRENSKLLKGKCNICEDQLSESEGAFKQLIRNIHGNYNLS